MDDQPDEEGTGLSDEEIEEKQHELDDLADRIDATRKRAAEDLEIGGSGRTFTDAGVSAQVEETGDTHHPPADA